MKEYFKMFSNLENDKKERVVNSCENEMIRKLNKQMYRRVTENVKENMRCDRCKMKYEMECGMICEMKWRMECEIECETCVLCLHTLHRPACPPSAPHGRGSGDGRAHCEGCAMCEMCE